jgi:ABC-type branched-subunit amino acid transport system ATPase component
MSAYLLEATGITKRFGGVVALRAVNVRQKPGETLGMIGPNGSGKTTFVNVISGHLRSNSGLIKFDGTTLTDRKPFQIANAGLTRTYQAVRVFGELSVRDNVAIALVDAPNPLDKEGISEVADWLSIGHLFGKTAGGLTLDEQRRLELLMRLAQRPKLIMLDEPVGGLSSTEVRAMVRLLSELKQRCSLFVIEHAMKVIRELADTVVVLIAGEKLAEGTPAEILADQRVIDKYLGSADA